MKFHLTSFLLGAAAASALLGKRMRPLLVELATTGYRIADIMAARVAIKREDLEDLLAEARARARAPRKAPPKEPGDGKAPRA